MALFLLFDPVSESSEPEILATCPCPDRTAEYVANELAYIVGEADLRLDL